MASQETEVAAAIIDTLRDCLPQKEFNGTYNREQLKDVAERRNPRRDLSASNLLSSRHNHRPHRNMTDYSQHPRQNNGPVSGKELSQKIGADHPLLIRLMRFLVAMHVVGEAGIDSYVATNITRHLTIPKLEVGTKHTYDLVCMAVMQLDPFLAKTGYKNPTDPKHCPFQDAFYTEDSLFEWFPKHPEYLDNFNLSRLKATKKGTHEEEHAGQATNGTEDGESGSVAARWVQPKQRPTHRLKILVGKKVDTINWCRSELERLIPKINRCKL